MSNNPPKSSTQYQFSQQGFQPLDNPQSTGEEAANNATIGISSQTAASQTPPHTRTIHNSTVTEKGGLFHRGVHGKRRTQNLDPKADGADHTSDDGEDTLNRMGKIYNKIRNFSIVTRYFIYVLPLALAIAVPIIVGVTTATDSRIGGVRIVWLFTWIEIGELTNKHFGLQNLN